jgi:hypothetical protein
MDEKLGRRQADPNTALQSLPVDAMDLAVDHNLKHAIQT